MFTLNFPNLLTLLRILLVPVVVAERGVVIPAGFLGKLKTSVQVAAIFASIAVPSTPAAVDALVYVAVAITVISGADYFLGVRRRIEEERSRRTVERSTA